MLAGKIGQIPISKAVLRHRLLRFKGL